MFNYGLIRLKRFISSFKVKLCNELFLSTAFNAPCICPKIRCDGYCKKKLELNKTLVVSTKLSSDLPLDSSATISKIEIPLLR